MQMKYNYKFIQPIAVCSEGIKGRKFYQYPQKVVHIKFPWILLKTKTFFNCITEYS